MGKDVAHVTRRRTGLQRGTEVAVADDFMELPVGDVEEPLGFPVSVVLHAFPAQDRVLERHRNRRIVAAHRVALADRLVFGSRKRRQKAIRLLFKELSPALQALLARHCRGGLARFDFSNCFQLVEGRMFHTGLLSSQYRTSPLIPPSCLPPVMKRDSDMARSPVGLRWTPFNFEWLAVWNALFGSYPTVRWACAAVRGCRDVTAECYRASSRGSVDLCPAAYAAPGRSAGGSNAA